MASTVLLPSGAPITVKVHPVVVFSICDAYIRRKEGQERVIGTLLGTLADGVMDIKNCYVVPHNESAETVGFVLCKHALGCWQRGRRGSSAVHLAPVPAATQACLPAWGSAGHSGAAACRTWSRNFLQMDSIIQAVHRYGA